MLGRSYGQMAFLALLIFLPLASLTVIFRVQDEQWQYDHPGDGHTYMAVSAMLMLVCLSLLAHILRQNSPLVFGILEIIFSLIFFNTTIVNANSIARALSSNQFTFATALVAMLALLAAATYVFLCGFENIGRGVSRSPRLAKAWCWLSLKV